MPTFSIFKTSAQISAMISSVGVRGATRFLPARACSVSGAGSAFRSSLPLGVRGKHLRIQTPKEPYTRAASAVRKLLSSLAEATDRGSDNICHQPPALQTIFRARTTASRTLDAGEHGFDLPELNPIAADLYLIVETTEKFDISVQPGNEQDPRFCKTRSRFALNGFGMNFSAVVPVGLDSPGPNRTPPMCSSPATPMGTGREMAIQQIDCVLAIGRPIGTDLSTLLRNCGRIHRIDGRLRRTIKIG